MLSFIYRSSKKDEMYLYLANKDGFDELEEGLKRVFGEPQFVMMIDLNKREKLARADKAKVIDELNEKGYYLQMPPQPHQLNKTNDD